MLDAHRSSSGLLDRVSERDVLERLVAGVRAGQSGVLVLRGEAGVGKTALLRHLSVAAQGCRIARVAGIESEMELAFAGLHALCAHLVSGIALRGASNAKAKAELGWRPRYPSWREGFAASLA